MEIRKLNALRGLAALIIVVSHYSNESGLWHATLGSGAGQLGVMQFFLLSGFLMAYLYLDTPPTPQNIKAFATARIARVIPLFLAAVFGTYFLSLIFPGSAHRYFFDINSIPWLISHLFLLAGNDVLWTIPVELHFYILFAVAWFLRPYLGAWLYLIAAALVALRFAVGFDEVTRTVFGLTVREKTTMSFDYFVLGVSFGQLYRRWQPKFTSHYCVLALLVILLLYPVILKQITGMAHGMWEDYRVLVLLGFAFFTVVFFVPKDNVILENKVGDFTGRVSYSIYLLHFPILRLYKEFGLASGWPGLACFVLSVLGVAQLSYMFLEFPARKAIREKLSLNRANVCCAY